MSETVTHFVKTGVCFYAPNAAVVAQTQQIATVPRSWVFVDVCQQFRLDQVAVFKKAVVSLHTGSRQVALVAGAGGPHINRQPSFSTVGWDEGTKVAKEADMDCEIERRTGLAGRCCRQKQ